MKLLPKTWWYLCECAGEELLFRMVLLWVFPNTLGILISSVTYGLAHLILFKPLMAFLCVPFGVILGWLYLTLPRPINFISVVVIHFAVGSLAYVCGLTDKLERR